MRQIHKENKAATKAGKEKPVEVLVIDGMSEFDLLYEATFTAEHGDGNKYAKWDALMNELFGIMQLLDPDELDCHIIVTARVAEKRRGGDGRVADADFFDSDLIPSLRGQFKNHLPHYFQIVTYFETDVVTGSIGGKRGQIPVHKMKLVRDSKDALVKNQWEHLWLAAGKPSTITNPRFDDVLDIIKELNE